MWKIYIHTYIYIYIYIYVYISVKGGIASGASITPDLNPYIIIPFMRSHKDISTMCSNVSNNWIKVYLYYHLQT